MKDTKENFCGACLAAPLVLAGVGATTIGATEEQKKKQKIQKQLLFWGGIILTILSIVAYFYFKKTCKDCK